MLGLSWSELLVIGVVALIVIGPKDLPKVLRLMGQMTRKAKNLAGEFQKGIDDMVREAELEDMRKKVEELSQTDLKREVEKTIDPDGTVNKALQIEELPTTVAETPAPAASPALETPAVTPQPSPEPPK
ncbi:MAG: twin-arginine translocase subunit TatB [Rhodospirillales bacterium]|nr:twin-arginine translocase subunit TatB [Rhodospirillales bacterium]